MGDKKLARAVRIILILAAILVTGFLLWWFLIRQPPIPQNIITLSGRIEGDDSTWPPRLQAAFARFACAKVT